MNMFEAEKIGIYIGMAFAVLLTLAVIAVLIWAAVPLFRKQKVAPRKMYWIYSISRNDGTGRRKYFGVDFYDTKRPHRYHQLDFNSAHEAFFTTKDYQDDGGYDVELLSLKEYEERMAKINEAAQGKGPLRRRRATR